MKMFNLSNYHSILAISLILLLQPKMSVCQIDTTNAFDCGNYNEFLLNTNVEDIEPYVERVLRDGTIYINQDRLDSLKFIFNKMTQEGTTFQEIGENESALDSNKVYKKYQQFYNGLEVEGGGYSMGYIKPGGPAPCILVPYLISPFIKTGISIILTPTISASTARNSLNADYIIKSDLIISHNLEFQCEYLLTYRVEYILGAKFLSYIDAQTGDIIETIEDVMEIGAPTETYGNVAFENFSQTGIKTLQSTDRRLTVYDFDNSCPSYNFVTLGEWTNNIIPSTASTNSNWTNEALPEVYQAYYCAYKAFPFWDELGSMFSFKKLNIASCNQEGTAAKIRGSLEEGWLAFARIAGTTTALYDVVNHEMGHCLVSGHTIISTKPGPGSIHEAVADMFGTYMEYKITNSLDWVIGDDEQVIEGAIDRDLQNPPSEWDCFLEVKDLGILDKYLRSRPLSHWFYLLSTGSQEIPSLAMDKTLKIIDEALNLAYSDIDYPILMEKTLIAAEDKYGACSLEFLSIARAWEHICVETGLPKENGLVVTCYFEISGETNVCEEADHTEFCVEYGLPNADYTFTISGPKNTSFISDCGMVGNSQTGCACLTLTDFPKYEYYPQVLTIEVKSNNDNLPFKQKKRFILLDCGHNDPTCEQYYDLQLQSTDSDEIPLAGNYSLLQFNPESKNLREVADIQDFENLTEMVIVFDIYGRILYSGLRANFDENELNTIGLIFIASINSEAQCTKVSKQFILSK